LSFLVVANFTKLFRCQNRIKRDFSMHSFYCGEFFESSVKSATVFANKLATEHSAALFKHFGGRVRVHWFAHLTMPANIARKETRAGLAGARRFWRR